MAPFGRVAIAVALSGLIGIATAQEQQVGAWSVGLTKAATGTFAATGSERGSRLGQYCYTEQGVCMWILTTEVACEADTRYPLVVNTESGAAVLEVVCLGVEERAAYAFTDFDAIDVIVRKARTFAVAVPTTNGLFQLSQFSLDGATRAVALMRRAAEAMGVGLGEAEGSLSF